MAAKDIPAADAAKIVKLLNSKDAELIERLSARYAMIEADGFDKGPATTKRLEEIRAMFAELNAKVYQLMAKGLTDQLVDTAAHEAEFAAKAVKAAGASVEIGTVVPDAKFLQTLVNTTPLPFADNGHTRLMPWLDVQEAGRLRRLEGALTAGIAEGMSTGDLVKVIRGTKAKDYTDGILQTSRRDATTIAITANSAVQNAARLETYKRMKSIAYVEWSAILDSRTSEICQSRSGTVYPIDKPHPKPPAHPRCRSILIPRRDDKGSKHEPYGDWLRKQPEDVQDDILGKARADVFRNNPDFDFKGFFAESGRYKTLGELRQHDERLFGEGGVKTPKPKPEPKAEPKAPAPEPERKRFTTPIDASVNDNTVSVISRKDATKRLNAQLAENAKAAAYDPRPEFRGVKAEQFGKAQLSTAFSDEAVSTLTAIMPEIDAIADAFAIPRLRAIRSLSGNGAIANMGDGTLGVHPTHFNAFAAKVGGNAEGSAALAKLKAEQAAMKAELDAMLKQIGEIRGEIETLAKAGDRDAYMNRAIDERQLHAAYRKLADKEFKLRGKIRTAERQETAPVATWKAGDDLKARPYTVDHYFSGIDRARCVLFHEMGHHVHQMVGKQGRRAVVGTPPVEKALKRKFFDKFHGAAPGNIGGRGIERKAQLTSTYATTNEFEWWAESFAAFMMGRPDLADPDLVKMIEELLDEIAKR